MTQKRQLAALLAGIITITVGCEDTAKKSVVHAAVPATTLRQADAPAKPGPVTAQQQKLPLQLPALPVSTAKRRSLIMLVPAVRDTKQDLIARVEHKFASGEQNYKAGHLEAARKDFDDAVDLMLESGYDPDSDPALSALFHHVVDSVYAYELQAFRGGEGFTQAAAVPAPIDEVAAVMLPADPRLKERAEEAA